MSLWTADKSVQHFSGAVKHYWRKTVYFFFENWTLSVTTYHGQLSPCAISEKSDDPVFRKFSGGRTNGETDR